MFPKRLSANLLANSKTMERTDHIDRDVQFEYINKRVTAFLTAKQPVISVDTNDARHRIMHGFESRCCSKSR